MAELATIARPYAEALYKSVAATADAPAAVQQLALLASVAADPALRQYADNPKVDSAEVLALVTSVLREPLLPSVRNFLAAVLDNDRLAALPEIASQFRALVNAQSGVSDATVFSAFPIDAGQLAEVTGALERRFGRKLNATVQLDPSLIGGIRVVVGDEVLDTSVKSRLEQMKQALVA